MYHPDSYFTYPSGLIVCGECVNTDIADTKAGRYVGEERVTPDMVTHLTDDTVEPYQCDNCLKQNEPYEELGEDLE